MLPVAGTSLHFDPGSDIGIKWSQKKIMPSSVKPVKSWACFSGLRLENGIPRTNDIFHISGPPRSILMIDISF